MSIQRCPSCQIEKPISEFNWRDRAHTRRQSYCRDCSNKAWRTWYSDGANRQKHLAQLGERRKQRRGRHKTLIEALKSVPCADCGQVFPPYVMDFDHLGEKVAPVSALATTYGTEALTAEIAKCEVVCANCHRIRTYARLKDRRVPPA